MYHAPGSLIIHSFLLTKGRDKGCKIGAGKGWRKAWPNARLRMIKGRLSFPPSLQIHVLPTPGPSHSSHWSKRAVSCSLCNNCNFQTKVRLELVFFPLRDNTAVLRQNWLALGDVPLLDYPFPSCLPPNPVTPNQPIISDVLQGSCSAGIQLAAYSGKGSGRWFHSFSLPS